MRGARDQTNSRAQFFKGSQKLRRNGQVLSRLNQWTIWSSNLFNDADKEEIQLGGIYCYKNYRISFEKIKDLLVERRKLMTTNEQDQFVLYTNASTKAITGVLMQIQDGIEKPCIFMSHNLSE